MLLFLIPAAVLTATTLLLIALWRLLLALRHRPAPRFWRRALKGGGSVPVRSSRSERPRR